jgi:hypothetical protein
MAVTDAAARAMVQNTCVRSPNGSAWRYCDARALKRKGIARAIMGGREMQGWVRVSPEAYGDDALRRKLLQTAVVFVRSLPAMQTPTCLFARSGNEHELRERRHRRGACLRHD